MIRRLIVFLIRKRLKLNKYQRFIFNNQTDKSVCYYFSEKELIKRYPTGITTPSSVSLNWILSCSNDITII